MYYALQIPHECCLILKTFKNSICSVAARNKPLIKPAMKRSFKVTQCSGGQHTTIQGQGGGSDSQSSIQLASAFWCRVLGLKLVSVVRWLEKSRLPAEVVLVALSLGWGGQ